MNLFMDTVTLPGCLVQGENPQPYFRAVNPDRAVLAEPTLNTTERERYGTGCGDRVLPYGMQDAYTRADAPVTLQTIVMENAHLKAVFLPAYGGKLWSLYSKDENRELLFANSMFRPANLAIRGAWTAGGIEWNLGHTGHSSFTCSDMHCVKMTAPDGESFLRMYEYEATHQQILQMDFHLPQDSKFLAVHVRIENALSEDAPLYWWTNIAVPLTEQTRVFSNTKRILYQSVFGPAHPAPGFGACDMPHQPNLGTIDVSYPARAPYSIEYFFQNARTLQSPFEVCIEGDGRGFMERSTQPLFARKMFCWGNGAGGQHWCDFLSERGKGDYVEIQAGLAPTQLHTTVLPACGTVCFTQLFGAYTAPADAATADWNAVLPAVTDAVEAHLSAASVVSQDADYAAKALLCGGEVLHTGGYYGGLELLRRRIAGEAAFAPQLAFPLPEAGHPFAAWRALCETGADLPCTALPLPYCTAPAWLPLLKKAAANGSVQTRYQYAVSLAENGREEEAQALLQTLFTQEQYAFAALALSQLKKRQGDAPARSAWALRAYSLVKHAMPHPCFAETAIDALVANGDYADAWALFEEIPAASRTDAMELSIAQAAVQLEKFAFLETAFAKEYATIREGAEGLADIYLEYQARLACAKSGAAFTQSAIDADAELPYTVNFRMFEGLYKS